MRNKSTYLLEIAMAKIQFTKVAILKGFAKKNKTWKSTQDLKTDVLERIKGPSIQNCCHTY